MTHHEGLVGYLLEKNRESPRTKNTEEARTSEDEERTCRTGTAQERAFRARHVHSEDNGESGLACTSHKQQGHAVSGMRNVPRKKQAHKSLSCKARHLPRKEPRVSPVRTSKRNEAKRGKDSSQTTASLPAKAELGRSLDTWTTEPQLPAIGRARRSVD